MSTISEVRGFLSDGSCYSAATTGITIYQPDGPIIDTIAVQGIVGVRRSAATVQIETQRGPAQLRLASQQAAIELEQFMLAQLAPQYRSRPLGTTAGGNAGSWLFFCGALAMLGSPFLPWFSAFGSTYSLANAANSAGDQSGLIEVLVIAGFALLGAALALGDRMSSKAARTWASLAGIAGIAEAIFRYYKVHNAGDGLISLEFGFYLLALGAVVVFVSQFVQSRR